MYNHIQELHVHVICSSYVHLTSQSVSNVYTSQGPITRSRDYIMEYYNNGTGFCNYGLAISTSALTHGRKPASLSATTVRMVNDLKSRITDSRVCKCFIFLLKRQGYGYSLPCFCPPSLHMSLVLLLSSSRSPDPGACFLCNSCPDDEEADQDSSTADCPSRPRGEGSASCVETTAWALLTLTSFGDTELTVCLAQWLVQIKSASGGFYSSQVSTDERKRSPHIMLIQVALPLSLGHNESPHRPQCLCWQDLYKNSEQEY